MRAFQFLVATLPGLARAQFRPDNYHLLSGGADLLPLSYNLSASQKAPQNTSSTPYINGGSFWYSSFIQASNNHSYLIISHLIANAEGSPFTALYRSSLLDITANTYAQFTTFRSGSFYNPNGFFNTTFDDWGLGTDEIDAVSYMHTYSMVSDMTYNLTYQLSSPALLNVGLAMFSCDDSPGYQWSMPYGRTTGFITIEGEKVDVNPDLSFTWYDRQWGNTPNAWTWLQVHLSPVLNANDTSSNYIPGDIVLSIWAWRGPRCGGPRFATLRENTRSEGGETIVVPVASLEPSSPGRNFSSSNTNRTYALDWDLTMEGGTELKIESVKDDQELHGESGGFVLATYEGYMNVSGKYKGMTVTGYGVLEIHQE